MDDNNLAIVLALILISLVIALAVYYARKWIVSFTRAMNQAQEAERNTNATA